MAFGQGHQRNKSLDKMAKLFHLACFALKTVPYFEYIQSEANWSDEISRDGSSGKWIVKDGFEASHCQIATELLHLPSFAVTKVFEFL